jgi:hypothetical protein
MASFLYIQTNAINYEAIRPRLPFRLHQEPDGPVPKSPIKHKIGV